MEIKKASNMQIHQGFQRINHTELFYKYFQIDSKKPTLMALPGGPGFGSEMYEEQLKPFQNLVNILLFDPRGCGKSPLPARLCEYNMEHYINDVAEIIKFAGNKFGFNKVIIHGYSYGSMAALGLAIQYPHLLEKLILVTGAPSYEFLSLAKKILAERGTAEQKAICEHYLWPGKFDPETKKEYWRLMSPLYSVKLAQTRETGYQYKSNPLVANYAFKNEYFRFDFTSQLNQIQCPTLILSGKHDWINPPVLAEKMHALINNSKLIIFENASHAITRDVAEEYQAAVRKFIQSLLS